MRKSLVVIILLAVFGYMIFSYVCAGTLFVNPVDILSGNVEIGLFAGGEEQAGKTEPSNEKSGEPADKQSDKTVTESATEPVTEPVDTPANEPVNENGNSSSTSSTPETNPEPVKETYQEAFERLNAQPYLYHDDKFYILYSMWYFLDGDNENFVLIHTEMSMYQYYGFYGYSVEVNMTKTKRGLYLDNIYHGVPDGTGGYKYVPAEAILYMDANENTYFCWLNENAEPVNLTDYQLEYARSTLKALDINSEEFISKAIP